MLAINPSISSAEDEYPLRFSQEVQDYIELNKSFAPASPSPTLDETRQSYLDFCAFIADNAIFAVQRNEYTIASDNSKIALRCYRPENPRTDAQILFFHGGGFVVGNLDSHDSICAQFAERAKMTVTAVDYRLAPKNQHPAAYNDCMNAYQHLLIYPRPQLSYAVIVLAGH